MQSGFQLLNTKNDMLTKGSQDEKETRKALRWLCSGSADGFRFPCGLRYRSSAFAQDGRINDTARALMKHGGVAGEPLRALARCIFLQ